MHRRVAWLSAALVCFAILAQAAAAKSKVLNTAEAKRVLTDDERKRAGSLDGKELFGWASQIVDQQPMKAYILFSVFREQFPTMVQGWINSAIALERADQRPRAAKIYANARKKFGDDQELSAATANNLQHMALSAYNEGRFDDAVKAYENIIEMMPNQAEIYVNYATVLLNAGKLHKALEACDSAMKIAPDSLAPINAKLRLLISMATPASTISASLTFDERQQAFQEAKRLAARGLAIDPNNPTINMQMGLIFRDGLEFRVAADYLKRALKGDPNNIEVMDTLSGTLSRMGFVDDAVELQLQLINKTNAPGTWFGLGTMLAPFDRLSSLGMQGHQRGIELYLKQVTSPRTLGISDGSHWQAISRVQELPSDSVNVERISAGGNVFGVTKPQAPLNADLDFPLKFVEKATYAVEFKDAHLHGTSGFVSVENTIYAIVGNNTEFTSLFSPATVRDTPLSTSDPIFHIYHPKISNYYHWTAEALPKLILALQHWEGPHRVYLPQRKLNPLVWETVEALTSADGPFPSRLQPEEWPLTANECAYVNEVRTIIWQQEDSDDPEQHDMWSDYLPSQAGLMALRGVAQALQQNLEPMRHSVVYVSRSGVREVLNEAILTEALRYMLGSELLVFTGSNAEMHSNRFLAQLRVFQSAHIIVGAHGAGLTNSVYAPDGAHMVEFTMDPHCNRCFGYIAEALNLDYHAVPQINTYYHLKYEMDAKKAALVALLIEKLAGEEAIPFRPLDSEDAANSGLTGPVAEVAKYVKVIRSVWRDEL